MDLKMILLSALLIHLIQVHGTKGYCTFNNHHIRDEWRLILIDNGTHLHLLRNNQVDNGAIVYMICNENDIIEMKCDNDNFNVALPLPSCNKPIDTMLLPTKIRNCPFDLYQVGFNFKCHANVYFIEIYRVCFNTNRMQVIYTINNAYPFVMRRPNNIRFDPDSIFPMKYFAAYNKREIYERFEQLLGKDQPFMSYNENERRLDRGHLVPAADYMTNIMIRSTFKMINVIPQFHSINSGNWNILEEWIRQPQNTPARVCNGVLPPVLELPDINGVKRPIFLKDNVLPVPLWTYKIVRNRKNEHFVFLQYNNIHDATIPEIPSKLCEQIPCPRCLALKNFNFYGYTVCCNVKAFIVNNVPFLMNQC